MSKYRLGLVGYPLGHSYSPLIHMQAFALAKLKGEYRLFSISPTNNHKFKALIEKIRHGKLAGLNVTVPYKETVIEHLDRLSPIAHKIGAVNTIYYENFQLVGENTDMAGFWSDLNIFLDETNAIREKNSIVMGSGGAARAVSYALIKNGWNVIMVARHIDKADLIRKQLLAVTRSNQENIYIEKSSSFVPGEIKIINFAQLSMMQKQIAEYGLIVNATSLGMPPYEKKCPWPENLSFPHGAFLYDLVYNPSTTLFMQQGLKQGLRVRNGMGMLITQALLAFEIWTGVVISIEMIDQRFSRRAEE